MEIPEGMQAGSEQNNSSPSTGKEEPVVKQLLANMINFSCPQQELEMILGLISYVSLQL